MYLKEFYFIRHGQTEHNAVNIMADHPNISLNAVGLKQAQEIEPTIAGLPLKSICHSPLKRATETKTIISTNLSVASYQISDFEECSFQTWDAMTRCGPTAHRDGEDHVRNYIQRVQKGLNKALSIKSPTLLIAHGGTHWALCCLMNITDHNWMIDNCVPVHFFSDDTGVWRASKLVQ